MSQNFYFGKDADIVTGSANFNSLIATGFATYGLSSAQSTAFGTLNTTLQSAYLAAIEPSTRTRVTIQAKNVALKAMRANAILLAKIVYATATVTDTQLVALGLLPRASRTPVPVPDSAPVLEITSVVGRTVFIRLHDAESERRGKPFGAVSANVYSFVGPAAPTDPREFHFEGSTTRNLTQIVLPNSVASGALVWLSSCWVSARAQTGPACQPVSFTLQGGNVLPEAA